MKDISRDELLKILKDNKQNMLDFAIEIENTIGAKNCIFTLKAAFEPDEPDYNNNFEFMSIFVDSLEYPGETHISINAISDDFIGECAEKILREIADGEQQEIKLILHGDNIDKIKRLIDSDIAVTDDGTVNSFYFDSGININIKPDADENFKIRMLDEYDEYFCSAFESENGDDYLSAIFDYSIRNPKYDDCGIIGCFGIGEELLGYLAYYGLDETMRDISYVCVSEVCRNSGYGKALLNFFKNKNIDDGKISYYSYPENEYSEKLAKSCGFLPCSYRYECEI